MKAILLLNLLILLISCNSIKDAKNPSVNLPDSLQLEDYNLALLFKANFNNELKFEKENDLFIRGNRNSVSENIDWILEGNGDAWTEDGKLYLSNTPRNKPGDEPHHVVLWNTMDLPENFLLEFYFSPQNSNNGLAIIFFSAIGKNGESIFDLTQPVRDGIFTNYHSGKIDCYHTSFWAAPRNSSNLRKNFGFNLVASGTDNISGKGAGPHRIRLFKYKGKIILETNNRIALQWEDKENILGAGKMGFRTMAYTGKAAYLDLKICEVIAVK